jgi:hypothetical protein
VAIAASGCGTSADRSITPAANPTPRPDPDTFLKDSNSDQNSAKASLPLKQ